MPITINGAPLNDGDPLLVNGVQAQAVTVNGTQVWRNTIPPSAIQNFTATSNRVGSILVTFTHSVGIPTPQHDLYIGGALVASDISTGYIHTIQGGDYSAFVRAHNVAGTIDSNSASCRSQVDIRVQQRPCHCLCCWFGCCLVAVWRSRSRQN